MEVLQIGRDRATVRLSEKELILLVSAINETQEAVEEWEFSSRVGAEPAEAEDLHLKLRALLDSMKASFTPSES